LKVFDKKKKIKRIRRQKTKAASNLSLWNPLKENNKKID
jgi:hypothetical protein